MADTFSESVLRHHTRDDDRGSDRRTTDFGRDRQSGDFTEMGSEEEDKDAQRVRTATMAGISLLSGNLFKVGGEGKFRSKNWRKRYFLLSEGALAYFTDDCKKPTSILKGGILLHKIEQVKAAESSEADKVERPCMFHIITDTRTYKLQAKTNVERDLWISTLQKAMVVAKKQNDSESFKNRTKIEITYFAYRGRPERIRLLAAEVGLLVVNHVVKDWASLKSELIDSGLSGSLPMIRFNDGTRTITQTNAAMRHIGRSYARYGDTEADAIMADMVADTLEDWRNRFDRVAYAPCWLKDADTVNEYATTVLPTQLKLFEKMLSNSSSKYFAGSSITYADFCVFDCLDSHMQIDATVLAKFPKLTAFCTMVKARPPIEKYLASRSAGDFVGKETSLTPI